jgi:hypothetical protein
VSENKENPGEVFESVEKFYAEIKKEVLTIKSEYLNYHTDIQ